MKHVLFYQLLNKIIPWAQMGYESIAHEAKGRMGYWLRGHEGERNNCFSKIQLVGQKIWRLDIFHKLKLDFLFYRQNIINMAALFANRGL